MEQRRKEKVKHNPIRRFWEQWDEDERKSAVRILGLAIAALGVFIFIALLSYLFHWKQDISLLSDPNMMDKGKEVGNIAGKSGAEIGRFLICRLFGLGSFALPLIIFAIAFRMVLNYCYMSLAKITALSLSGAAIASLLLGHIGIITGTGALFGGGPGGQLGAFCAEWICNLIGHIPCALLILVLVMCWLFFSSHRFSVWMSGLGKKKEAAVERSAGKDGDIAVASPCQDEIAIDDTPAIIPEDTEDMLEDDADVAEVEDSEVDDEEEDNGIEVQVDENLNVPVVKDLPPIDIRLDAQFGGLDKYLMPSLELLDNHSEGKFEVSQEELQRNNNKIRTTLRNYKIEVLDVKAVMGPTVTLYKVYPAPGVQVSQIKRLSEDIGISLNAKGVRIITLSDSVGIEVANDRPSIVPLKALLNNDKYRNSKAELPVAIGYTITQEVKVFDLAEAPHLLIAGATRQGKSVCLNVIINSLLFGKHPSELKFVFIDPKMVEFSAYSKLLHHYLAVLPTAADEEEEQKNAIVKKAKDAELVLRSLCKEMDERYEMIAKAGVSNIKDYNNKFKQRKLNPQNGHKFLPYLVTIVDEYADLTMSAGASPEARTASKSITNSIIRLAQKGRAAGLHVILATQRPSVDVISGSIKTNFPMRIAFRVSSRTDSMTILDIPGAEKLIGRGDMLFSAGIDIERVQCAYISTDEIDKVNGVIEEQKGLGRSFSTPFYLPEPDESPEGGEGGVAGGDLGTLDANFAEAAKLVVTSQRGSTTDLQRRLGMGYARSGKVMDQLQQAGIVGPPNGSKMRSVLVGDLDTLREILDSLGV